MSNENQLMASGIYPKDTGASNTPGLVYAANEARFTAGHYQEPLTAYAVGWRDPANLDGMLQRFFPEVPVGRRFEFKRADNAQAFLADEDTERSIGGVFKRVEARGETVLGKTANRGLTTRVDHDEEGLGDDWRERKVAWLMQRILRAELRRCFALLHAASGGNGGTWTLASNPDGAVRALLREATNVSGVRPNIVLYGEEAYDGRLDVYEGQDTPYAGRAAAMSLGDLATKFMVDLVDVVKARYQATANGKAAIVPAVIYAYLAEQGASKDDPSNFKRFTSATRQGPRWGVYVEEHPKFTDISVEHYSTPTITSDLGMKKYPVTLDLEGGEGGEGGGE